MANERSSFVEICWHLNLALHLRCLEKVRNIFCQIVEFNDAFTMVESVKKLTNFSHIQVWICHLTPPGDSQQLFQPNHMLQLWFHLSQNGSLNDPCMKHETLINYWRGTVSLGFEPVKWDSVGCIKANPYFRMAENNPLDSTSPSLWWRFRLATMQPWSRKQFSTKFPILWHLDTITVEKMVSSAFKIWLTKLTTP